MPEQFENPEATKLEDETIADATAEKKIEHTAEKAAQKSAKTEQLYDQGHNIFSK
jgi:hypothetical protein